MVVVRRRHKLTETVTSASTGCPTNTVNSAMIAAIALRHFGDVITVVFAVRYSVVAAVTRKCPGKSWDTLVSLV